MRITRMFHRIKQKKSRNLKRSIAMLIIFCLVIHGVLVLADTLKAKPNYDQFGTSISDTRNYNPFVEFGLSKKRKVDIVFDLINKSQTEANAFINKVNSMLKPALAEKGIDASIHTNIVNVTTGTKPILDSLQSKIWRDEAERYYSNVSDILAAEYTDTTKLNNIVTNLLQNNVIFMGLGTATNKDQLENLILNNNHNGMYTDNQSLDAAMQKVVNYIIGRITANININLGDTAFDLNTIQSKVTSILKPKLVGANIDAKINVKKSATLSQITAISAGGRFSLALKSDGTVWAWGANDGYQLGMGNDPTEIINYDTARQITNFTDVTAISAGLTFSLALKSDGTVWSWGRGSLGLGTGITEARVPTQIPNLADVKYIWAGDQMAYAVKKDGTLWAWGLVHPINNEVPVQITGVSNVKMAVGGKR